MLDRDYEQGDLILKLESGLQPACGPVNGQLRPALSHSAIISFWQLEKACEPMAFVRLIEGNGWHLSKLQAGRVTALICSLHAVECVKA